MKAEIKERINKLSSDESKLLVHQLRNLVIEKNKTKKSDSPKKLVAYIKPKAGFNMNNFQLEIKEVLPKHMVPSSFELIDDIPLLPNGKIDKYTLDKKKSAPIATQMKNEATNSALENQLIEIWEEVLDFAPIKSDDNFFEIGGDSMISIKIFWMIEKKLKIKLSPNILFTHSTIKEIAEKVSNSTSNKDKSIVEDVGSYKHVENELKHIVPYRESGTKTPLFCIHGGEGHILFYQNFAGFLDSDRPVYFVQPKGVDGDDKLHDNIEEMAQAYLQEIIQTYTGEDYNLIFYCCGPLVVEMSNLLKASGKKANVIIVDSSPVMPEDSTEIAREKRYFFFLKRLLENPLKTLEKSILYRFRRYIVPLYVSILKDEYVKRHIRIRKNLEEVQNNFKWKKFDAKCTLIFGESGLVEFEKKDIEGWNYWCDSEVRVLHNSGNHFNIFENPHAKSLGESVEKVCV